MLVDNPLYHSPLSLNPSDLSDFVNMELFTTQGSTTSDSREPSPSVSTPLFSPLPIISEPNPSDWFNFSFEEDFAKPDPLVPPPVTSVPWDFLTLSNDSPDPGSTSTSTALSPSFAIDPQLMSSTELLIAAHDSEVKDKVENGREEEDEEEEATAVVVTSPVKVGGKGKSRKGTVQSGGVQKKATISAVVRDGDDPRDDGDDWRPSPEEYKKMSSKEKRQLRNKISARNFRVRRKGELITFVRPP
jgi:bZIP-type transcription factor MBZ1